MRKHVRLMLKSLTAALILSLATGRSALAMFGLAADQVATGLVQHIDYLHHTITVNGRIYAVSPQAAFRGIGGFAVLHIGMPIQFVTGSPSIHPGPGAAAKAEATPPAPSITRITWLPALPAQPGGHP